MATEKTVAVRLVATVAGYKSALKDASEQTRRFGTSVKDTGSSVRKSFSDFANASSEDLQKVGHASLIAGGVIAAGFGIAVKAAMDFEKEMSNVAAVSGATADQMDQLSSAAIEAGAATVFSASEAARATTELAKAGVAIDDVLSGGLTGALNLASAGNLDLATAAELAANAMTTFGLAGGDVPRIADSLAAGANKSAADVDTLGQALNQTGLVADQMGLSMEETVGVLSLFSQAGLKGSDAGTSLKTMLMRLTPSSVEAKNAMEELGLEFYDAAGNFVGVSDSADQLKEKLEPLSQEQRNLALQTIFGSDAIRAATVLYQNGGQGVEDWTQAVSDSGYAAELAEQKTNNLAGDLEQLKGSIETALIQGGSQATDSMRFLAQSVTNVVNGIGELPAPIQTAFLGATGILGLGTAAIGVYGTFKPKIDEVKAALDGMGSSAQFVSRNMGTIAVGAGGAAAALGIMAWALGEQAKEQAEFNAAAQSFADTMKELGGATAEFNKQIREAFSESGIGDVLAGTNADLEIFTRGVRESGTELDEWQRLIGQGSSGVQALPEYLRRAAEGGSELADEIMRLSSEGEITDGELIKLIGGLDTLNDQVDTGAQKLDIENQMVGELGAEAESTTPETVKLGDAIGDAGEEAAAAADKFDDLVEGVKDYFDSTTAVLGTAMAFEDALDSLIGSLYVNGNVWDIATEAGRENTQALIDAKDAAVDHGLELLRQGGSVEDATALTLGHVDALKDMMAQVGFTDQQIEDLIVQMGLTPQQITTQFLTPGLVEAQTEVGTLTEVVRGLDGTVATVTFGLDTWQFWANAKAVTDYLNSLTPEQQYAAAQTIAGVHSANGNIVDYYAGGGIRRENHIAQIAPAGSMRVWAEPETGGEAYIPLASSKRARSLDIWAETGRRLSAPMMMANPGGMSGGGSRSSTTITHAPSITIQTNDVDQGVRSGVREMRKQAIYAGGR